MAGGPAARKPSEADKEYFGRFAEGYSPYSGRDLQRMTDPLVDLTRSFQRPRVLEVGCASGQFSAALSAAADRPEMRSCGVDIAAPVLKRFPFAGVCGSAFQLPFAEGIFDLVCLPASLHHLFPLDETLDEIARVLAPGGFVYCVEPNHYHPHRRFFMRFQSLYRMYRDVNDVPIRHDQLRQLLLRREIDVFRFDFVNFEFRHPGVLQRVQNFLAALPLPGWTNRWRMPWFLLIGKKRGCP